jgi:hypothetical protein
MQRVRCTPLVVAIGLAALPAPALAASWSEPQSLGASANLSGPAVATTPDGGALVAWHVGGRHRDVLAARASAEGRFERAETVARARRGVGSVTAALPTRGSALLAWEELGAPGHAGVVTAEAAGPGPFGAPQALENTPRRPFGTRALVGPEGAAAVTWEILRGGLVTRERPGPGQPFAAARPLTDASIFNWSQALGPGGRTLLAWNGGSPFRVMARQWTLGGELGPAVPLSDPGRMAREPAVAATRDGFVVAWAQSDGRTYRVKVAVAGPDGRFGPAQIVSGSSETARAPEVAVDGRGNVVVTWISGGPRQGFARPRGRIRAAVAPAPGAAFGRPMQVAPAGTWNTNLQLASGGGATHVLWVRGRPSAPKRVMVASRPPGGRFGRPRAVSPPLEVFSAAIAAGSGERALVAWTSERWQRLRVDPPTRVWVARRLP